MIFYSDESWDFEFSKSLNHLSQSLNWLSDFLQNAKYTDFGHTSQNPKNPDFSTNTSR